MAKGQQGSDRTFEFNDPAAIAGILIAVLAIGWITWYFAHTEISAVYIYLRYVQLWFLSLAGSFVDLPGLSHVNQWVQKMCAPQDGWLLCTRDFSTVRWDQIGDSSMVVNGLLLVVLVIWCFRMFRVVDREHPTIRYAKDHSIKSFIQENAELYPHLRVFSRLDMVSKPLDDSLFGMSLTSRQFAYKHQLVSGWQETGDGDFVPVLNRQAATTILVAQLGRHWTRSADLTPGETLLLAIVLPRVAATDPLMDDKAFAQALADSEGLIKWCWEHFNPPEEKKTARSKNSDRKKEMVDGSSDGVEQYAWLKPTFALEHPRSIIAKYIQHPAVVELIAHHAYRRTILYACYVRASALGVFPSADVRWMRFFDRELWYLRSSIGRQVAFAEGGNAVYSHYLYESKARHPIVEPQIDKALNALEVAMHKFKYTAADKKAYEQSIKENPP